MKRLTFALATLLVLATLTVVCAQAQTPAPTPAPAAAAPTPAPSKIDSGDTAWMLTSTALVLMMTAPGLALFYGGMVRQKNVLATIMQSFIIMAVITIQWVLWGYSLAFGPDMGGIIGGLEWIGLHGVGLEPRRATSTPFPHQVFMSVPDDVRHHHAGADHRRVRRAHEVLGLPALHRAVGDLRLRSARPLGVGRRAAG